MIVDELVIVSVVIDTRSGKKIIGATPIGVAPVLKYAQKLNREQ